MPLPSEVGGYVFAGGRSSRMGRDKATLELAGKPLLGHAVKKLRRLCMEVHVLSANPEFAAYGPIVPDIHPGCGPLGGMEAALRHSAFAWNLFMPVDMPFLPSAFLDDWVRRTLIHENRGARLSMFTVEGVPQPALVMVHREVTPFVTSAVERGEFKLYPVLEQTGRELAARLGVLPGITFCNLPWDDLPWNDRAGDDEAIFTEADQQGKHLWFANLNTPEEFAEAERHVAAHESSLR